MLLLVPLLLRSFLAKIWNHPPPFTEGKERPNKVQTDYSRLVGGRFNKQGSILTRIQISRSLYPVLQILIVYIEVFTGFSHIYCQIGTTPHFHLKTVSWGSSGKGKDQWNTNANNMKRVGSLQLSRSWVNWLSPVLNDFPQQFFIFISQLLVWCMGMLNLLTYIDELFKIIYYSSI